jgi:hypothetical protein
LLPFDPAIDVQALPNITEVIIKTRQILPTCEVTLFPLRKLAKVYISFSILARLSRTTVSKL